MYIIYSKQDKKDSQTSFRNSKSYKHLFLQILRILSLITKFIFRNKLTSQYDLEKKNYYLFFIQNIQAFELKKTDILKF